MSTEYELHTQGARPAPAPAYDGRDPDRNKAPADCHASCNVCFSPAGDKWPCSKAAAVKKDTTVTGAVPMAQAAGLWWLAVDKDDVVTFGCKDRTTVNQYINDRMCEHPELLRLLYAYPPKASDIEEQARMYRALRHIGTTQDQDALKVLKDIGDGFAVSQTPTPAEFDAAIRCVTNALNLKD